MNTTKTLQAALALFCSVTITNAFAVEGNSHCANDSLTNKIVVSTGINHRISDSALYDWGYGGNTNYPTPNNNVDSFWIVTRLASNYQPRPATPFSYTGNYLALGGYPYVMKVANTVLYSYWAEYLPGGNCTEFPADNTQHYSQWISVYSDAGGQNSSLANAIGDGYEYTRCFTVCHPDSLRFDLSVLGDDLIDTVKVDDHVLYIAPDPDVHAKYYCTNIISLHPTLYVTAGRHVIKIYNRDNAGGHLGINVMGSVTAKTNSLVPTKKDDRCTPNFVQTEAVANVYHNAPSSIYPVPNDGNFYIQSAGNGQLEIMDYSGRLVLQQQLGNGRNKVSIPNALSGIYILRQVGANGTTVDKILVQ